MEPFSISAALSTMLSNPMTLLSLASTLGSTIFRSNAQDKVNAAQAAATNAQMQRNRQMTEERNAAIAAATPKLQRPAQEEQQKSIASNIASYIAPQDNTDAAKSFMPGTPGAPQEIVDRRNTALASAAQKGKDYAKGLSDISAFKLQNILNGTTLGRLAEDGQRFSTNMGASNALLPNELQAATMKGRTSNTIADLLAGAGALTAGVAGQQVGKALGKRPDTGGVGGEWTYGLVSPT